MTLKPIVFWALIARAVDREPGDTNMSVNPWSRSSVKKAVAARYGSRVILKVLVPRAGLQILCLFRPTHEKELILQLSHRRRTTLCHLCALALISTQLEIRKHHLGSAIQLGLRTSRDQNFRYG